MRWSLPDRNRAESWCSQLGSGRHHTRHSFCTCLFTKMSMALSLKSWPNEPRLRSLRWGVGGAYLHYALCSRPATVPQDTADRRRNYLQDMAVRVQARKER